MRVGSDNSLSVPITDANDKAVNKNDVVARFSNNNLTPVSGGKVKFGKPVGDKKAGKYVGTVIFELRYTTSN